MSPLSDWRAVDGARYGFLGFALAFVALPLYVLLPHHYASEFGVPLAWLGGLLLACRLLDAFIDPYIGRVCDHLFARSTAAALLAAQLASAALAVGFIALFFPPVRGLPAVLAWAAGALVLTYTSYSVLSVLHQSWGAMLGGDELQRSRIVVWREGLGLGGVLLASMLPGLFGLPITAIVFVFLLGAGCWSLARAPRPSTNTHPSAASLWLPWRQLAFQRLMAVFLLNGIASAIPATLVLFFVQDKLQASPGVEPFFLACYFLCAALSFPLWLRAIARWGLARSWLVGMLSAIGVFVYATQLGVGDDFGFFVVCALSGAALGADLAVPGALLAGVIAQAGDRGAHEGAYFGWWNFATKLNLAMAAGLALPVLGWAGYAPGSRDPTALDALTAAYCLLPCALKLIAAALLYTSFVRRASNFHATATGHP